MNAPTVTKHPATGYQAEQARLEDTRALRATVRRRYLMLEIVADELRRGVPATPAELDDGPI